MSAPDPSYDQALAALHRYDRTLRRSFDRVAAFAHEVRRHDVRAVGRRALPQALLRVHGPAGGRTGGRIMIHNQSPETISVSARAEAFVCESKGRSAQPHAWLVGTNEIGPGRRVAALLWLDFADTDLGPGEVFGDVTLDGGPLTLHVAIEASLR